MSVSTGEVKSIRLTDSEKAFINLVARSADVGDGWRKVSDLLWHMASLYADELPKLVEKHPTEQKIRLTPSGLIVHRYLGQSHIST